MSILQTHVPADIILSSASSSHDFKSSQSIDDMVREHAFVGKGGSDHDRMSVGKGKSDRPINWVCLVSMRERERRNLMWGRDRAEQM